MRVRNFETEKEARMFVDDKISEDYKILSEGANSIRIKKVQYGSFAAHILIFILTVWWTLGIANVLYAVYKYVTGDEVLVKFQG